MDALKRLLRDQSGAGVIEYGLIAAVIAIMIITTINSLGSQLKAVGL